VPGVRRLALVPIALLLVFGAAAPAGAATSAPATRHDPVLLVHGFNGSGSGWRVMVASLRASGYAADEIDAMTYDSYESNVTTAHRIASEVTRLEARTGASRVDVVSHSMGAISTRYYLDHLGGAAHVDAWASLAGVNEGTIWAYGCYPLAPCREMVPTSSLLRGLNDTASPATTRYAAWWSPCDDAIVPHTNAELPGARNTQTRCLRHSQLKTDPTVIDGVKRFLADADHSAR
jgi:triacylglycerol esterase/lipase EstA (alpha/beta hydrolase family)